MTRRSREPLSRRLLVAAGLIGLAVLGHFLWNSPLLDLWDPDRGVLWVPVATAVKGLPLLLFVIIAVRLARSRERRWLDQALTDEIDGEAITTEEYAILRSPKRRREAIRAMRRRAGPRAAHLLRRLQEEQVTLAMILSRVAEPDDPAAVQQRAHCRSLRVSLAAIPGAAPAAPARDAG